MHINFLCSKHTDWVYSHPADAIHFLARDELQGTMLFMDGNYRDAIAYLGCAFDICAILLEVEEGQNNKLIEKAQTISAFLCSAYDRLKLKEYRCAVEDRTAMLMVAVTRSPKISVTSPFSSQNK